MTPSNKIKGEVYVVMSLKPELELLAQGAEGRVYRDFFMGQQCVRKVRFCKKYRHPVIDEKLTASRLAKEARNLARSSKFGISVPAVLFVDAKNSSLYLEYIPSPSVKSYLSTLSIGEEVFLKKLTREIGRTVGKLHACGIVHGDLTTSNMLWDNEATVLTLVDFGLSFFSKLSEDQAVDLYVLERAFLSTHPDSISHFSDILHAYTENNAQAALVIRKLQEELEAESVVWWDNINVKDLEFSKFFTAAFIDI